MNSYRLRIQVVTWYEVVVQAKSRDDAIVSAEALSPEYIQSASEAVEIETGLADPGTVKLVEAA